MSDYKGAYAQPTVAESGQASWIVGRVVPVAATTATLLSGSHARSTLTITNGGGAALFVGATDGITDSSGETLTIAAAGTLTLTHDAAIWVYSVAGDATTVTYAEVA